MTELRKVLLQGAAVFGVTLDDTAADRFERYAALLREWNERVNLTAILDDEGIATRHFVDSLSLAPRLRDTLAARPTCAPPLRLVDVGSGAGFPGLPLALAFPQLEVVLVDSLAKRVAFLDAVVADLKLDNVTTRHARAEDAARLLDCRGTFDFAAARAVASMPVLCEYCLPFLKVGGTFCAMKGRTDERDLPMDRALALLGGEPGPVDWFALPGTDMQRTLVFVRKTRPTPPAYPRKAGKPEKEPLA
jgi:16S rRNA (guanine527-N7)-methyltransferase